MDLVQTIERVRKTIQVTWANGRKRPNEAATRQVIINPILRSLGWNVEDPMEVEVELPTDEGKFIDYALKSDDKIALLIEAKSLGSDLNDAKSIGQLSSYGHLNDVAWCVLTDGAKWRVYNVRKNARLALLEWDLNDVTKTAYAIQMFEYLSRNAFQKQNGWDRLFQKCEQISTDKIVHKILSQLLREPTRKFTNAIQEMSEAKDLRPQDIRDSILRQLWEFPDAFKNPGRLDVLDSSEDTTHSERVESPEEILEGNKGIPLRAAFGDKWHLEHKCSPETRLILETLIPVILKNAKTSVPQWHQNHLSFAAENGGIWLYITTGKKVLVLDMIVKPGVFDSKKLAEELGVSLFLDELTLKEKLNLPSSINIYPGDNPKRACITLRIKNDFSVSNPSLASLIRKANVAFQV